MENYTTAHELAHISEFRNNVRELAIDAAYSNLEASILEGNSGQQKLRNFSLSVINNPDSKLEAMAYGVARSFGVSGTYSISAAKPVLKAVIQHMAGLTPAEILGLNE